MASKTLQQLNTKTLGVAAGTLPVVRLSNGQKVPTGTVGALLMNIRTYDKANEAQRVDLEPSIQAAIPTLCQVGLFDLFTPEEWASKRSPGRSLVGKLAQDYIM